MMSYLTKLITLQYTSRNKQYLLFHILSRLSIGADTKIPLQVSGEEGNSFFPCPIWFTSEVKLFCSQQMSFPSAHILQELESRAYSLNLSNTIYITDKALSGHHCSNHLLCTVHLCITAKKGFLRMYPDTF